MAIKVFSQFGYGLLRSTRLNRYSNLLSWKKMARFGFSSRAMIGNSAVKIGTHDGTFHCDEVLACAILKFLPQYKDASIVR